MRINEYFYHLQGKDNFVLRNHTHNEIEIIEVVSGGGRVLKNDKTYALMSRYIYVVDARNAHIFYPKPEDCKDYIRNKIVVDADLFLNYFSNLGLENVISELFCAAPVSTIDASNVDKLFKKINELCTLGGTNMGFAWGYLTELVFWIYSNINKKQLIGRDTTIQKMLDIIAERQGVTTLSEISEALHLDKYYLCHLFKSETGRTLSSYLSDKVFEKATALLTATDYQIEKIAVFCGFSSAASFTRFFKNKCDISPLKYRKENKKILSTVL